MKSIELETRVSMSGVDSYTWNKLFQIIDKEFGIEKVVLFGSRAMGRYRPDSDIDLALVGLKIDFDKILHLKTLIRIAKIPYKIDILGYNNLPPDHPLRKHIDRVGIVIWEREPQPEPLNTPAQ